MGSSETEALALLAGHGRLPVMVAASAREKGYKVHVFGFNGMMDPGLAEVSESITVLPFCQLDSLFGSIEERGIKRAVTIGSVAQTSVLAGRPLFDELAWELWKRLPDRRVDTIMTLLIDELSRRGIEVVEAVRFLEQFFAPKGVLTAREPSASEWEDIGFGAGIAKAIGKLDIGQTVVVRHKAVMAVEAVEGTDRAIVRGSELAMSGPGPGEQGGAVVVKVAKPGQDMRFDVPAVGMDTLGVMSSRAAGVLAVEAGMVLMVERDAMVASADERGLCIVGVDLANLRAEHG